VFVGECNIPGERDSIFVGRSAGWYLDATEEPWSTNYRMYSYISKELPDIIKSNFPTTGRIGLCGHR
jgi:S-formylglutathione hydrolase